MYGSMILRAWALHACMYVCTYSNRRSKGVTTYVARIQGVSHMLASAS